MAKAAKLKDTFDIVVDGEEYKLKMTYGLLNRLLDAVGGSEAEAAGAGFSKATRDSMFAEALNKRGKSGVFENFDKARLDEIDIEDPVALMGWLQDHVLDFFLSAAEQATAAGKKFEARAVALMPSNVSTAT
jgi:hypothetical protein